MPEIDAWFATSVCRGFVDAMCYFGVHPNAITSLALAFSIGFLTLHTKGRFALAAACIVIRQAFDCLDGEVARRCDKRSRFGLYYDMFADTVFWACMIYIIARQFRIGRIASWAIATTTCICILTTTMLSQQTTLANMPQAVKTGGGPLRLAVDNTMVLFTGIACVYYLYFVGLPST
jgi:phosphatidylglycerophosphate synthase